MKKKFWVAFFLIDMLVVLAVIAFFVPSLGIGKIIGVGRSYTDEYCVDCGAFCKRSYIGLFWIPFLESTEMVEEVGIKTLHDKFLTPCTTHRWNVYHLVRNSLPLNFSDTPYFPFNLVAFKRDPTRTDMEAFIASYPELAAQMAPVLFDYAKRGKNNKVFSDLQLSIAMNEEQEIKDMLASMTAELASLAN